MEYNIFMAIPFIIGESDKDVAVFEGSHLLAAFKSADLAVEYGDEFYDLDKHNKKIPYFRVYDNYQALVISMPNLKKITIAARISLTLLK